MPEFTMEGNGMKAIGRITYRCAECGERIDDAQVIFADATNAYAGTAPPVPLTKTTRTYHLGHHPEVDDGR